MLGMPTPSHILLKKIGQWPKHFSVICAILVQVIGKAMPLTQVLLRQWHGPIDYGLDLSGVRPQAMVPNEAPYNENLFSTKDALRRISV